MRHVFAKLALSALALALTSAAQAQIYADFTVSHGSTPLGTFRAKLEYQKAPRTCANFIGLATGRRPWIKVSSGQIMENKPYYNGLTFHRLIHNFMIQGGSPNGLGTDGPGYVIQDEYDATLRHSGRYFLSMAKSNLPGTGGSQFFITFEPSPSLDDKHSVFGEVIEGKAVIDAFTNAANFPTDRTAAGAAPGDPAYSDKPVTPIKMDSVVISGLGLESFDLDNPALGLPVITRTPLVGTRNNANKTFAVTFERGFQTEHLITYSTDLQNWTYLRNIRSADTVEDFTYTMTGVTFPRFYAASARIDYGFLPNPPSAFLPAGSQLRLLDRSGKAMTLVSNGTGGGTWNHSNGSSGNLTSLTTADGSVSTGFFSNASSSAHLFPLAQVNATFSSAAGPDAWTSLGLILSFHSAKTGWVEGSAVKGSGSVAVQQSFAITP
ncbi:peptidylprolyl isomerase [Luteolibacter luteus]|uniref:peptidylprolyl isomerase n=1 Tax=Luteolibacter luteus TaxID=2728835 RepID=A0A858REG3_9BACT|nr:peptidylprolyl isomerase [Luteolibacter luteus]QJE94799.1 peptidylprolyl isomerase [Luteolibacter luteus]